MLERKNIDRVFQENLKDLEIYPSKRVWNKIENHLSDKPVKKPIALWKKMSGIAMILMAFVSAGFFFYNTNSTTVIQPQVSESGIETTKEGPEKKLVPVFIKPASNLAENKKEIKTTRKPQQPILANRATNKVIVTSNDISTVYSTIENKYIVDKDVFLEELNQGESITARMENIPDIETKPAAADKKWSIGPTVAPVFYNSLQDGSPLNDALAENNKTSDNAMSYGVKINYQVSNKFFIQSGVNKVELAYNTQGVNALISSSKNAISNINTSKAGVIVTPVRSVQGLSSEKELSKSGVSGEINQSIEYYELPIEMKYNLYDKKLGLNLVGGFSTLILSNNSVSMVTQNSITDLGGANNLNDLNFSGNVGVDLDYKISKSWYLNVAPMFKYQFNTYSGNSGNFRPYYFGLYSGLNYKF
jgi:hypothetical protein